MTVKRFGVSIEEETLQSLDNFVMDNKFPNRSQAIRFLIEKNIIEKKWLCNNEVAGAIVLLYNHHKKDITNQSTNVQHDYHHLILSSQHVHLDHDNCLETIIVKGRSKDLTELSDQLISLKGIKHGKLVMTKVVGFFCPNGNTKNKIVTLNNGYYETAYGGLNYGDTQVDDYM